MFPAMQASLAKWEEKLDGPLLTEEDKNSLVQNCSTLKALYAEKKRSKKQKKQLKEVTQHINQHIAASASLKPKAALGLLYSEFYYDEVKQVGEAIKLAKACFDSLILELDTLEEHDFKLVTALMQQLRDNLAAWASPYV